MKDEIITILSQSIDKDLVEAMLDSYESVQSLYLDGNYEDTLGKSGKFVENVFRVLVHISKKTKLTEIKSGQINDISDELEKMPSTSMSETIRIVIPRVAKLVYTMRSKLGAEHVKPITPDFIDAKFTVSACDWILAELLRTYHVRDSSKVDELIEKIKTKKQIKSESLEILIANQIDNMPITDLVVIALRIQDNQTKSQLSKTIGEIGRDVGSWLRGGNINNRLIKTGLIRKVGTMEDQNVFSLTVKGMILAEKLLDHIRSQGSVTRN
ncbi:MAG: hypothetical protein WAL88_08380 [Nitrosotalea sp.]